MRRFCRIYLPFLASMLFALILYSIVPHRSLAGLWLPDLWHNPSPLPLNSVIHEIMLTGVIPQNDFVLNGPAWSLVHELRISMMLPFMVMLVGRYPLRWIGAVTIGVALLMQGLTLSIVINGTIDSPFVWIKSLFDTLAVMPCFMAGIFLARYRHAILSWVTALGDSWRAALWLIGLLPFCLFDAFAQRLVVILSSVVLIVMTLSSARAKRIILSKPCAWLGKISYSLYLVHVPILLAAIQASDPFLPSAPASNAIVTAVVVGLSLACATLFHYAIEAPVTRLGKSMTANRGIEVKSCR
jgi:peptidoglycan/LPS O-acetylase OafA/YrhL